MIPFRNSSGGGFHETETVVGFTMETDRLSGAAVGAVKKKLDNIAFKVHMFFTIFSSGYGDTTASRS